MKLSELIKDLENNYNPDAEVVMEMVLGECIHKR